MRRLDVEGQRGATLVDYALMVALIALMASFPLLLTGYKIKQTFQTIDIKLERASAAGQAGS